ncbi:open rectifier potassium channel protein 1 [Tribolium madens]|uniref:open rectifier potassium channel protein 1 n=1 Tax=Tribolium madens TaxID=41895 RepID=UPI001CF74E61|nr:open rectifier potassium channel protein 1 [Tribolium madens]
MMSKKEWFVVLCIFIFYLMMGAAFFQWKESEKEQERLQNKDCLRKKVDKFVAQIFDKSASLPNEKEFFQALTDYCGKPIKRGMTEIREDNKWDFYHSLFFVITVVSTIGYGNLSPTTTLTRIVMIFYGLIGIPLNGIVMVTLGNYFGRSFTKLYQRWKNKSNENDLTRLGLISQVILYLVPGFLFFIFIPAGLMVLFENWDYDVAVYYAFVTLTTIGFGDYVAGVDQPHQFSDYHWFYKIFLLIWVIGGLGYVVMILGFITQFFQSKNVKRIEQIISENIKKTPIRIRQELRSLLQEFLILKVKRGKAFDYIPRRISRTSSCPDLDIYRNMNSPTMVRKRALSECPGYYNLQTFESQSDLMDRIEQEQQNDLLLKVVDALSNISDPEEGTYENLPDSDILASERYGSKWSLKSQTLALPKSQRRRAISDIRVPSMHKVEARHDIWSDRTRTFSEPSSETENRSENLLTRFKNIFMGPKEDKNDVEHGRRRASMFTTTEDRYLRQTNRGRVSVLSTQQQDAFLEQTSIADFIRALSAITVPESMLPPGAPKRKLGTASLSPPKGPSPPRARRQAIRPNLQTRRTSLMPDTHNVQNERRRYSLRPVEENFLAPPPYTPKPPEEARNTRKFSRPNIPVITVSGVSPVQRQVNKRDNKND